MSQSSRKNLVEYITKNIKKGYSLESLKWALISQGYAKVIVENAITDANKELAKKAPILKEKPQIKYQIIDEHNRPITIHKPKWKKTISSVKRFFK
jgi:hypothetical protein